MQITPSQAFNHIKESVIQYLETAYKIAHPSVFAERAEIFRQRGVIAQEPFIEATPSFPTSQKLRELEQKYSNKLPIGLTDLVNHGVPVDRFALYTHQEEALLAAFNASCPNLLVATGTGSGKTESFLLPILADILKEAANWQATSAQLARGQYDKVNNVWLHSRRHEKRPAAIRALILYPMNALVNDQLARLRRILSLGGSPEWQRSNLRGNQIHFGMYTGLAMPTGSWKNSTKVQSFLDYYESLRQDWDKLSPDLQNSGSWPRPDSSEMLCRWDMQVAPPDIMVTNYSMLEYMLVRPIENNIFEQTRHWLEADSNARFTLVLDEAHTYTGVKGTEVAHLVRRLKERLGLQASSPKFRAIATTASVPADASSQLYSFAADLFGEPSTSFNIVRVASSSLAVSTPDPLQTNVQALTAFEHFHEKFNIQKPAEAIEQLAQDLALPLNSNFNHAPQLQLYQLLEKNPTVNWVRTQTARRATLLATITQEAWGTLGTVEQKDKATAGLLAAGSFARPSELQAQETPPLLSMRIHAFMRGIPGLWACMNQNCPEVAPTFQNPGEIRPIGRLYTEPRAWCEANCGGRVLELFSCRHCGLLFLGGIPDKQESLWHWSDDLDGSKQDLNKYMIFGVEKPDAAAKPGYRSIRTTLKLGSTDPDAREVYEIEPRKEDLKATDNSPFPKQCPRCQNYAAPKKEGSSGREVIEPLRTRGPRSFSILAEDAFRVQPRATKGDAPNYGRKSLLFSDSRMEAAQLAADLRNDHHNDLFRQLVYRVLHSCKTCAGTGQVRQPGAFRIGQPIEVNIVNCANCKATGRNSNPHLLSFADLQRGVINLQLKLGINPTNGLKPDFFKLTETNELLAGETAQRSFHLALRRELAEPAFALEPLGLAIWHLSLPANMGNFTGLTEQESQLFIQIAARILATENILLPPEPLKPWEWPSNELEDYKRKVLIWADRNLASYPQAVAYTMDTYRKLGRYVRAVGQVLLSQNRISNIENWLQVIRKELWEALTNLQILESAGNRKENKLPMGIRIDRFSLHPLAEEVYRCVACAYVMGEALLGICRRCGQTSQPIAVNSLQNYYRNSALYALPGSGYDDPYPLRAIEHTAQIAGSDARNYERWFQDMFHANQNKQDYRIDILSVTTTMEMGIDIGSLLSVGLRNVPPSVANYQQRAGRAGRRGSSIATVMTFAQFRSHDQYYFHKPPEIVTGIPRVPTLYLGNLVIARRHVRSVVLQSFFQLHYGNQSSSDLFNAWGKVASYIQQGLFEKIRSYIKTNRATLLERCNKVIVSDLERFLEDWLDNLPSEIQESLQRAEEQDGLLEHLIKVSLLPKYAFPVDVVSLNIPNSSANSTDADSAELLGNDSAMQRDLKIALAEYVPGAEVIRGDFPNTYIYQSVGLYNAYQRNPTYTPVEKIIQCKNCQSVEIIKETESVPDTCKVCNDTNLDPRSYLVPDGFTTDAAKPEADRVLYKGGGRERAGTVTPARLLIGQNTFAQGQVRPPISSRLHTLVHTGELFYCNRGVDPDIGFLICPKCGRALEPGNTTRHTYPADVPPLLGRHRGPRAGTPCSNTTNFDNYVYLGYKFNSEVMLIGVDLPTELDAPINEPAGRAIWYSLGTLLANAAAIELQVDSSELKVGVRPVRRGPGKLHGEIFIYDDVPGGAGYARAIDQNLAAIFKRALDLGRNCGNPECAGACYNCMYDYRNQQLHPLLDRGLGVALLEYLLENKMPQVNQAKIKQYLLALEGYAPPGFQIESGGTVDNFECACFVQTPDGRKLGLLVVHPLAARPERVDESLRLRILGRHGIDLRSVTSFDLERRPFWVIQEQVN